MVDGNAARAGNERCAGADGKYVSCLNGKVVRCCRVDVWLPQQFAERAAFHQLDVDGTNEYRKQRASTTAVISENSVKETHNIQSYHGRSQTLRSPTCSLAVLTTTRTDNQVRE